MAVCGIADASVVPDLADHFRDRRCERRPIFCIVSQQAGANMRNRLLLAMWIVASVLPLAACEEQETTAVELTFGPSPTLPAPQHSWMPTVNFATAVGWPAGGKPTPAR